MPSAAAGFRDPGQCAAADLAGSAGLGRCDRRCLRRGRRRSGQRVCLWLSNRLEALVALLACARNGYVCNPSLHLNYRVEQVSELLRHIDFPRDLVEEGWGADVTGRVSSRRCRRCEALPAAAGAHAGAELPGPEVEAPRRSPRSTTTRTSVAYLAFTSGTTGMPKGVMHSDNTLLANAATWCATGATIRARCCSASAALAPHRLGRGRPGADRRHGAGGRRSARRH